MPDYLKQAVSSVLGGNSYPRREAGRAARSRMVVAFGQQRAQDRVHHRSSSMPA